MPKGDEELHPDSFQSVPLESKSNLQPNLEAFSSVAQAKETELQSSHPSAGDPIR
jgi:hypothetical protein